MFFSKLGVLGKLGILISAVDNPFSYIQALSKISQFQQFIRLFYLLFSKSLVDDIFFENIVSVIGVSSSLKSLSLSFDSNKLENQALEYLSQFILGCSSLETIHLILNNNQVSDQGIQFIEQTIPKLQNIKEIVLFLSGTFITEKGFSGLVNSFSQCLYLENLHLQLIKTPLKLIQSKEAFDFYCYKNLYKLTLNLEQEILDYLYQFQHEVLKINDQQLLPKN
ncbi:hypothetical protein ABPG74_003023 [Tetrahymena malaccensis]